MNSYACRLIQHYCVALCPVIFVYRNMSLSQATHTRSRAGEPFLRTPVQIVCIQRENSEEQNKVLEPFVIIVNYCIIIIN